MDQTPSKVKQVMDSLETVKEDEERLDDMLNAIRVLENPNNAKPDNLTLGRAIQVLASQEMIDPRVDHTWKTMKNEVKKLIKSRRKRRKKLDKQYSFLMEENINNTHMHIDHLISKYKKDLPKSAHNPHEREICLEKARHCDDLTEIKEMLVG